MCHIYMYYLFVSFFIDTHIAFTYAEQIFVICRMDALLKRSSLVQQIQQNHREILVLQTELELLRLKTYPTFKYRLINQS